MKKTLLTLSAVATTLALNAQITITSNDVVGPLDIVIQNSDTVPSVAIGSGGANQTWDFSTGLVAHEEDTMAFTAANWLPNHSSFPNANLAVEQDGMEIYLEKSSSALSVIGFAGDPFGLGSPIISPINPGDVIINFPANYNDSYNNYSMQRMSFPGSAIGLPVDSVVAITHTTKTGTVDGWGTLTTPLGSFDALRFNTMSVSTDSTWGYTFGIATLMDDGGDTTYTYNYWSDAPDTGFPLMEIDHDGNDNPNRITWLKVNPIASITENKVEINLYPNPVSEVLTLEGTTNGTYNLTDINGKLVASGTTNPGQTTIDVQQLESGLYLISLQNANGTIISNQKVEVK